MSLWTEVADRVYHRRYDPLDVSVCVVRGARGLLVVDTRSSHREADEVRADLRWFGGAAVVAVVNTHAHFDHCFGNYRFGSGSDLDAPIYGHQRMPAHLTRYEVPMRADWIERRVEPVEDWREVVITPPTHLVAELTALDLGDRSVELIHLGRGHTDNDLLLHVPGAAAWLVGDLLEESGPPAYGVDSFPLDWPGTIGLLRERLVASATLVPGHGAAVGPGFAAAQHAELQRVAALIRELHAAGVPADQALAEGGDRWPYPPDHLGSAVAQGYLQLAAIAS